LHSSRSSYSKIRENEVRLSERKERLQDKNYFKMAVSFRQRSITFLTFLLTCLALALLAGGLSTQYWVVAQAEIKNKTQASGFINFGLFEGTRRLNVGYGERRTPMDILDILYKDNSFMIKDLYITTLGCICASMLFGILSAIMAIVNTASTPSEKICQIPGMITLNVLAAITSGGALLTWIIQYFVKLRNNVLIRDIREKPFFWTSKGLANIGHSFWLVVVAFAIFILNITILHFLRTKRKKKQDNKRAIVEATTKPNGNLMLY